MRSYRKSSHSVHDLKVHLVWITKYRYNVLTQDIGLRTRELIRQICDKNDIVILRGVVSKDHIHLYISYPPKLSVSDMVKWFKGRTSRKLQQESPQLKKTYWGKHFWAIGYAAFSSGQITDEMIQEYLTHHDKHSNHNNEDFTIE
jgi:putative transposase